MVTAQFGELDFSADNIGIEIIKSLYENGFPYLEITEVGKTEFYDVVVICEKDSRKEKYTKANKLRIISTS